MPVLSGSPVGGHALQEGTYVVVRIDAKATMEPLGSHAKNIAARLKFSEYVAFVGPASRFNKYDVWGRSLLLCELHFIGTGMPTPHPQYVTDEAMSVPIYPANSHPSSGSPRAPHAPHPPLPPHWRNCYQHTLMTRTVYINDINIENPSGARLSRKDVLRHYAFTFEDREREEQKFTALLRELWDVSCCETEEHVGIGVTKNTTLEDEDEVYDPQPSSIEVYDGGSRRFTTPRATASRQPHAQLTVAISLDLSSISQPPNPRGFFEELQVLRDIEDKIQILDTPYQPIHYLEPMVS
ncbi:hypothetical protein K439DRAFT_1661265 [Ramaria rubella]|nr:hypothetical protein K439DRAFT_1661265 [Ramaria rubella]